MSISFNNAAGVNALTPNTMDNITRAPQHANAAVNIDYPADTFGEPKKEEGSFWGKLIKTIVGVGVIGGALVLIKNKTKWIEVAMKDGSKEAADGFANKYIKRPLNWVAEQFEKAYKSTIGRFTSNKADATAADAKAADAKPADAKVADAPKADATTATPAPAAQAPGTKPAEATPAPAAETKKPDPAPAK